jgi:hypothetical protein
MRRLTVLSLPLQFVFPVLAKAPACQTAAEKIGGKKVFRIFVQAVVRLLDESKASSKMLTIKVQRRDGRIAVYESSRSTGGHILKIFLGP